MHSVQEQGQRELQAFFKGMEDQIPFASALALTRTIQDAQQSFRGHLRGVIDRPTSYTLRGVRIRPARKRDQNAYLWLVDEATKGTPPAKYLGPLIEGGGRGHKRHEKALHRAGILPRGWRTVPGQDAPLNRFGNLTGGRYTKILSDLRASPDPEQNRTGRSRRYFVRKKGGKPVGIYQRTSKRRLRSILHFIDTEPRYRPVIHMDKVVEKVIERRYRNHLIDAMLQADRTSRQKQATTTQPGMLGRLLSTATRFTSGVSGGVR